MTFTSFDQLVVVIPSLPESNSLSIAIGSAVTIILLIAAFVIGAVISELFILIGRKIILRPIIRNRVKDEVNRVFKHEALQDLLKADFNAREAYSYLHTCGIDLHLYAGRIRVVGGTAVSLLLGAIYAFYLGYGYLTVVTIIILGLGVFCLGLYRSYKYDQYVSALSAVLHRSGK